MGERGAGHPGHPGAQAALDEICNKISDLNKWREIFHFRGLEISTTTHQGRPGCGTDGGHGPGGAGGTPQPRCPPAVPRPPPASPRRGGQPLSLGMATGLRKVLFGDASHVFSHDWAQAHFRFREPHSDLAYALEADKGGTRAILMAVQGNIIKYLLFVRNTEYTHLERLCKISPKEQGEALAAALADSLWAAGEGREATVCLISAASHFVPTADYKADNFTERIQLFNFFENAAAQKFIFDHINCFKSEGSKGLILFLYSLLFSRTLERVQKDLGGTTAHLLEFSCGTVICTQPLLHVVLAGSACPGRRCEVGFLRWSREEAGHRLPPHQRDAQRPLQHQQAAPVRLEDGARFSSVLLQRAARADENSPPHSRHSLPSLGRGPLCRHKQPREEVSVSRDGNQDQVARRGCQLERDGSLLLRHASVSPSCHRALRSEGERALPPAKPGADAERMPCCAGRHTCSESLHQWCAITGDDTSLHTIFGWWDAVCFSLKLAEERKEHGNTISFQAEVLKKKKKEKKEVL